MFGHDFARRLKTLWRKKDWASIMALTILEFNHAAFSDPGKRDVAIISVGFGLGSMTDLEKPNAYLAYLDETVKAFTERGEMTVPNVTAPTGFN